MGYLSHRADESEIKPGDHIYTWRTAFTYSYHGFEGFKIENKVVHFTSQENASSGSVWNLSAGFPSSHTNLSALCLNTLDCEFSQPKTEDSSNPSLCSYCLSTNQNLPASCLTIPICGFHQPGSGVILSCLNCFIGTGSLYLFPYGVSKCEYISKIRGGTCTIAKSDPPEEVIHRAMYLLQNGFGKYDVVTNNCEDFALYCKTGLLISGKPVTGSSGQVNFFSNLPWKTVLCDRVNFFANAPLRAVVSSTLPKFVSAAVSMGAVTMVVSTGVHCYNRYKSDIGVRDDVVKVKVEDVQWLLRNQ